MNNREKGFTLVELLVVIAILGILAAVAIPNVIPAISRGTEAARAAELSNVQLVVTVAMADNQTEYIQPGLLDSTHDLRVGVTGKKISDYLRGGVASLHYSYMVSKDGAVAQNP